MCEFTKPLRFAWYHHVATRDTPMNQQITTPFYCLSPIANPSIAPYWETASARSAPIGRPCCIAQSYRRERSHLSLRLIEGEEIIPIPSADDKHVCLLGFEMLVAVIFACWEFFCRCRPFRRSRSRSPPKRRRPASPSPQRGRRRRRPSSRLVLVGRVAHWYFSVMICGVQPYPPGYS